jgi:hypothetical protein
VAKNLGSHLGSEEQRRKMLAMAADVQNVTHVMEELETLEHILQREETENPGQVSGRSIEINPEISETLNRLTLNTALRSGACPCQHVPWWNGARKSQRMLRRKSIE